MMTYQNDRDELRSTSSALLRSSQENTTVSFRSCRKEAGTFGLYQKRLFILMGIYWITASFFLVLPFYFFKKQKFIDCEEFDTVCVNKLCTLHRDDINLYIEHYYTLTYRFGLFCDNEWLRVVYKTLTETTSWIGLLIYGFVADIKGRKVAFKISWRFYTIGLILFTATYTQFLITFGYVIACINCFPSLVVQFVLLFEQTDSNHRFKACLLLLFFLLIGPLLASFLYGLLVYIGVKYTVTALCTVPAFFLSVATGLLEESAVYLYKSDKIHAFWIINKITKINNIAPILVDLSQSTWLNYENYTISLIETMLHVKTRCKLLLGILFMFTFFFNAKLSQLSLDEFTSSTERGLIMNITSAVATLSAILLLAKFNSGKYFIISLLSVLTVVIYIAFKSLGWNSKVAEIVLSVILRYFSNLSYGIFIIWAIETFPTICRAQCLSFVLCGCSFATMLAYGLNNFETILLCISLVLNLLIMGSLKFLNANQNKKLLDTLHGEYYDYNDHFHRL